MILFSKIRNFVLALACLVLAGGIGYRLGENHIGIGLRNNQVILNKSSANAPVDFSLFWNVWSRVHQYYIDANTIDNQKLLYGAIGGMVNALGDPYTAFLPPTDNSQFKQDMSGSFEGIGAELGLKDSRIIVVTPLTGSPAEKAGIKPGDFILKVNEEDTSNWSVNDAVTKIRGPKGTNVTLNILHETDTSPKDISIIRDTIVTPQVKEWVENVKKIKEVQALPDILQKYGNDPRQIAYIQLTRFGDRLEEEWSTAVDAVMSARNSGNVSGLILDLRNNPGGYLDGAVYIGGEFLKSGVVVTQQNSDGSKNNYAVDRQGRLTDIPMVVIINKGSASAAEIVTGALKDYGRAKIVGETSFGKGSVQTPQDLPGGSSVHITTGKWLTPKGDWISKKGIVPDIEIKSDNTQNATADAQLAKAIETLLK